MPFKDSSVTPSLGILGISEAEECLYRWLLAHPGATSPQIAKSLKLTAIQTQRLVNSIAVKGLVTYAPERQRRYIPASPDIALRALASHRQEELRRIEHVIEEMGEVAQSKRRNKRERMVELVVGHAAARNVLEQIVRASHEEVLVLTRPPVLISQLDAPYEREQGHEIEARTRGVHFRSIVDHDFLSMPGAVAKVRHDIDIGEEVRVISTVPSKILISDRKIALIPLDPKGTERAALLVRSSDLLDTICALFDVLWERAIPISLRRNGSIISTDPHTREAKRTTGLIQLLATGLNDKRVAAELGISTRTLERRIVAMMQDLGTRTRFQTGWLLALQMSADGFPSKTHATADLSAQRAGRRMSPRE